MSGSNKEGLDNVDNGMGDALGESGTAVNDTVGKKPMTDEQAATMVQKVFRGHKAKQNKLSLSEIAQLADEDEKAFNKFSNKISKTDLKYDQKLESKAAWVSKVNEYAGLEPDLSRKKLYEISSGYFEAKEAIAKNLKGKEGVEKEMIEKSSEGIAHGYADLVSKRVKDEVSSSMTPEKYMAAMYTAMDIAIDMQGEDINIDKAVKAAQKRVLKDLTEEHQSAHDRSGTFSKAVAMGAAPLTAPMKMAGFGEAADKYVGFADDAIRGAYSGADKTVGNLLGKPAGKLAGVIAGGVTAAAVYTPTMIAEGLEVAAVAAGVGLGGAAAGVVGTAALGVGAAVGGVAAVGAGVVGAGVVTASAVGALTAAAPTIAYGARMLPRVLYRGAKAGLGSARDLAEAAGQGMNEGFRGMYNAHRFSNVEKEIASSMQTLDLLEEKINKDPNTPANVKQMLGDIKAKEMAYASGKMIDKDGKTVAMTALDKASLLTDIQKKHEQLGIHIPQDKQKLFEMAFNDVNTGIAKQTALFAEVTNAREKRDLDRSAVKDKREIDLGKSKLIRENKDAGLWNKTMGAYMDNFVNPMLLHMPKVIQDRFPKTVENAQKMASARTDDRLLTEIARDPNMGIGAVAALKPGAEIGQGDKYNQQQSDVNLKLQDIEEKRKFRARRDYGGEITAKEVEELNRASAAREVAANKPARKTFMQAVFGGANKDNGSEGIALTEVNLNAASMVDGAPGKSPVTDRPRTSSVSSMGTDPESRSSDGGSPRSDSTTKPTVFGKVVHALHLDRKTRNAAKAAVQEFGGEGLGLVAVDEKNQTSTPIVVGSSKSNKPLVR